jgi:sarcosine oxidase/L-pipecolate oxidase
MKEMAKQCREAGVSFAAGQVNEFIVEHGDVKGARTKDGTVYKASKLIVLAAGSWSPAILPELANNLTATGQVLATIQLTAEEAQRYSQTVSPQGIVCYIPTVTHASLDCYSPSL